MENIKKVMAWWEDQSDTAKSIMTGNSFGDGKSHSSLTGSEIERLWTTEMNLHRLRQYVDLGSDITDNELEEVEKKIDFDALKDENECSGNFIFTKRLWMREEAVESMCCGIHTQDIELASGETIYFAFDYGH